MLEVLWCIISFYCKIAVIISTFYLNNIREIIMNYTLKKNMSMSRLLTIIFYIMYITVQLIDTYYIKTKDISWYINIITLLPLILPIQVLFTNSKKSYIWLCFVLFFYFISAIESIFMYHDWFSWLNTVVCVINGIVIFLFSFRDA